MKPTPQLIFLLSLCLALVTFLAWVYFSTYQPKEKQAAYLFCPKKTPLYNPENSLSVLSYNVQYFAGKSYVFYYDLANNKGKDIRPSRLEIDATLDGIAQLIVEQNADVVLLQEINDGASSTDKRDQLKELLSRLPKGLYPCYSEAFYWKADFIPHPNIMGSVGMKLVTLSKYKLQNAIRHQLPKPPKNWLYTQFSLKRAILETELAQPQGLSPIKILNTHFDAFAQGSNTMEQQVAMTKGLLEEFDNKSVPWILGGDLNLLLPNQFKQLQSSQRYLYKPETELTPLLSWPHIPNLKLLDSDAQNWFTHLPNDPDVKNPDRVIDYLLYSPMLALKDKAVLNQGKALKLSDHFPISAKFCLNKE